MGFPNDWCVAAFIVLASCDSPAEESGDQACAEIERDYLEALMQAERSCGAPEDCSERSALCDATDPQASTPSAVNIDAVPPLQEIERRWKAEGCDDPDTICGSPGVACEAGTCEADLP